MRRRRSTPTRVNAATTAGSSLAVLLVLAATAGAGEVRDIKELGVVRSAVIVYPPYTHVKPMIVLEVAGGKKRLLGPGDALEFRPHPLHGEILSTPHRFKFLRCERDPDPDAVFFVFDVNCDGLTIRKFRWAEPQGHPLAAMEFPVEKGVFVLTEAQREHVARESGGLLKDVTLAPDKDGVRVVSLPAGSRLARTGVRAGDVLVVVNKRSFVGLTGCFLRLRAELKKKRAIDLRIRRDGESVSLRFDPRSGEERAEAK